MKRNIRRIDELRSVSPDSLLASFKGLKWRGLGSMAHSSLVAEKLAFDVFSLLKESASV